MTSNHNRLALTAIALTVILSVLVGCAGPAAAPTAAPAPAQPTAAPQATAAPKPTAAPPPAPTTAVGVVLPTKDEPRWLQDQAVFEKAGFTPLFSQGDSAKEKANVEALISQGIKVLIITPQDATAAAATAQEAHDAGIKVISYDR